MTKSIIITGASSGIGRACAETFLEQGWTVGLVARREALLREVAGGRRNAVVLAGDVTDAETVERVFDTFTERAGRLDVLFNNAGIFTPAAPIDEIPLADWRAALNVNLDAMFLCARAAFGRMRRQDPQGGRIINNGSISAHAPREGSATYTTTKHAITGLTKTISLDGRPFDIACGQIDIGNAMTDMLKDISDRAIAAGQLPPPTMDVRHVAEAVVQMAELPPAANVQFMTIMATKMPYIGRG
jgi:NAD(P)-dependent dehydrogenase (short-subunit alcohol dehydrogenase family)